MFDLESEIKQWRAELGRAGIRDQEVVDELELHLRQHFSELARSGSSDTEAFLGAANRLGSGEVLQKEFSKVKRYRSRKWRDNPLALNLAGAWLVLMGLNCLSQVVWLRLSLGSWWYWYWTRGELIVAAVCLVVSLQILAGIGVLRRGRISRYLALVFLSLDCFSAAWVLVEFFQNAYACFASHGTFIFLGISIGIRFEWVTYLLSLGFSLFGIFTLLRPAVRELFQPAVAGSGPSVEHRY